MMSRDEGPFRPDGTGVRGDCVTARWFLERHAFHKIEVTFLHPVEEARRLPVPAGGELKPLVERLNEILFGPQDYFIVARA